MPDEKQKPDADLTYLERRKRYFTEEGRKKMRPIGYDGIRQEVLEEIILEVKKKVKEKKDRANYLVAQKKLTFDFGTGIKIGIDAVIEILENLK